MSDSANKSGSKDHNPETEPSDGVYLVELERRSGYYIFHSPEDNTSVDGVTINSNYVGTLGSFETECDDFEISDENVVNLIYER